MRIGELAELVGFPGTGRTIEYVSHEFYRTATGSSPRNGSARIRAPCSASSVEHRLELPGSECIAQRLALDPVGHRGAVAVHVGQGGAGG
jgi:hypothetical protein